MNKKSSIDMLRERIKTLKNENRETQKAFAERCDIDPNKLSNLMTRGKAKSQPPVQLVVYNGP